MSVGSAVAFGVVGGLFLLGAGAFGYAASQGFWITWQHGQAQHSGLGSLGLGLNVGAWVAHGVLPGIGSAPAGGGGSASGSGSGGAGGAGIVKRLPPPTENGEASGFGAPILSDEVLAECDPQLPTAQTCIGWTRGWNTAYVIGESMKRVKSYARTNGLAYYQPRRQKDAEQDILTRNANWILLTMSRNARIYDIGFNTTRGTRSANYMMERAIIMELGYPNYIYDPQP